MYYAIECKMKRSIIGCSNKRQRKPKGQSEIDNLETLVTMGPQDTGKRPKNKKLNGWETQTTSNYKNQVGVNPSVGEEYAVTCYLNMQYLIR